MWKEYGEEGSSVRQAAWCEAPQSRDCQWEEVAFRTAQRATGAVFL
jgi:hypothetical protein